MTTTNDKSSFIASGCHAHLLAGAGDVVLGGPFCVLGRVVLIVGGGRLVCVVAAIGDILWLPRRCGRCGTWWALIHQVTWPGHLVLER